MALTINVNTRNDILATLATRFDSGLLRIYSGSKPVTANLAPSGTLLVSISLPADSFGAVSSGAIAKNGTWSDSSADAAGTAGWFRISQTGDTDVQDASYSRIDGTVTATGGGGDITLDNTSIALAQSVEITSFTLNAPS